MKGGLTIDVLAEALFARNARLVVSMQIRATTDEGAAEAALPFLDLAPIHIDNNTPTKLAFVGAFSQKFLGSRCKRAGTRTARLRRRRNDRRGYYAVVFEVSCGGGTASFTSLAGSRAAGNDRRKLRGGALRSCKRCRI